MPGSSCLASDHADDDEGSHDPVTRVVNSEISHKSECERHRPPSGAPTWLYVLAGRAESPRRPAEEPGHVGVRPGATTWPAHGSKVEPTRTRVRFRPSRHRP